MLNKQLLNKFDRDGYFKLKIFPKNITNQFYNEFSKSIKLILEREFPTKTKQFKLGNKRWLVNNGLFFLEKKNHKHFVEIYDQIPRTHIFYNLVNYHKIIKVVNILLNREYTNNIYINPASIRMDIPKNYKYSYGWHRDNNSNIPNSNFIQIWFPIINNINPNIGGLHILEGSHKHNLKTSSTKIERNKLKLGKTVRPSLNTSVYNASDFKEKIITANVGEMVFFNSALIHKSGLNKTKDKIRYVAAAFYHDTTNKKWKFFYKNHKS